MPDERAAEQRRLVVLRVQVFADAREVAEYLVAQVPVLLDLTAAETDVAKRILDFSSGVVFGLGSGMHRVDRNVFLLAPDGMEVEGSRPPASPSRRKRRPGRQSGGGRDGGRSGPPSPAGTANVRQGAVGGR